MRVHGRVNSTTSADLEKTLLRLIDAGARRVVLDLSLLKNVAIGGVRALQFRLELYNALNRVNLGNPNTTVTSSAFGTIAAQNGLPRQLQIAARLSF